MYNTKTAIKKGKVEGKRIYWASWALFGCCVLVALMCLLPLWMLLVNATRSAEEIRSSIDLIPSTYFFANLNTLLENDLPLLQGFINSAVIAFSSTLLSVYFSALTAYGFSMYNFRFKKLLYAVVLGIIMIPGQLGMIGWYQLVVDLKMYDTYVPLIVPGIAAASTVFFLCQYFAANFSHEIVEAARIDGAKEFYTFNFIAVPLVMPALATMAIFSVIGSWNNYIGPLMILTTPARFTLPMLVEQLKGDIYSQDFGAIYAGVFITILPLIVIYLLFSRQIIRGVALGGVKE